MTEELKQLREALRRVKHEAASLADAQVIALEALTQRPAAQTEREAPYGYCPECGAPGVTRERRPDGDDKCSNGHRYPSRSAHASLPTQPAAQATPEPVDWKPIKTSKGGREAVRNFFRSTLKRHDFDDYITGALAADFACVLGGYLQAITTAATPEPVGEAVAWWYIEDGEEKFGHPNGYRPDDARPLVFGDTRPAPGVPEGWRIFRTHDGLDVHTPDGDACYVESKATGDRRIPEEVLHALCCDLLAAAQAKGADK